MLKQSAQTLVKIIVNASETPSSQFPPSFFLFLSCLPFFSPSFPSSIPLPLSVIKLIILISLKQEIDSNTSVHVNSDAVHDSLLLLYLSTVSKIHAKLTVQENNFYSV